MQKVLHFIKRHHDGKSPLLLALSGGSDSLALLAILKKVQQIYPFKLHVAHVDHGWREESAAQEAGLRQMVDYPFHSTRLEGVAKNEEAARHARHGFFHELKQKHGFQAVLLAHHADDQAETVLKRLFEGSHLSHLNGIKEVVDIEGLTCWRPLLHLTKQELSSYRDSEVFVDSTNSDKAYLRNRMRLELMPLLENSFGKGISKNLVRLGQKATRLDSYFTWRLEDYASSILSSPWGISFDFSGFAKERSLEWEWLIKKSFPREFSEDLIKALEEGVSNHWVGRSWYVDRQRLFRLSSRATSWQVEYLEGPQEERRSWKDVWRGHLVASVPAGCSLAPASPDLPLRFATKNLGEWWSEHKVPALLRSYAPVVLRQGLVEAEFLTGKSPKSGSCHLQLKLV